jgi:hypothetical protein
MSSSSAEVPDPASAAASAGAEEVVAVVVVEVVVVEVVVVEVVVVEVVVVLVIQREQGFPGGFSIHPSSDPNRSAGA